jgi:hypothetical protein
VRNGGKFNYNNLNSLARRRRERPRVFHSSMAAIYMLWHKAVRFGPSSNNIVYSSTYIRASVSSDPLSPILNCVLSLHISTAEQLFIIMQ